MINCLWTTSDDELQHLYHLCLNFIHPSQHLSDMPVTSEHCLRTFNGNLADEFAPDLLVFIPQ